jgi:vitamin B12 transporter
MNIMQKILLIITLIASLNTNAALGPIPIYLNTEYRTDSPVIGSIASTLSFSADDIKATGANTFLDFLATVPSVGLYNPYGNVAALFMRGGDSDHTLVLVDGVSVNSIDSLNGAVEYGLTSIALNDIEKIEIIKNSGSVLYGSSAISGVINITTKKGADGASATLGIKFGTHNSKTYTLSANNGGKDGFVRFTHNKYTTDGINAQTGDTTGEKDSINNQTTQIKAGNKHFDIGYLESRNKTQYDGFSGTDAGELSDIKLNKIAINANKKFSNTWKSTFSLTQTKSKRDSGASATTIGDKYKKTTITALNDIKIDDALLNIGLSQVKSENTTNKLKHSSKDLFINWQKNINDLDINAGLRYIKHNKFGNHTVYNMGFGKELGNGIRLTSNYNTAFQAPTLKEVTSGNQINDLEPETSKNINIELSKNHVWGEVSLSLFKTKEKDGIGYTGGWPNSIYINEDQYSAKGVDLSLNANISGYNLSFNHVYSKSSVNNSNTQPIRRPKNITNLTIAKQYAKFNARAQVITRSSSLDSGVALDGYTLINLSNSYNINNSAKVLLNIKNATDKNYTIANGYNQPSRTVEIGLDYQF